MSVAAGSSPVRPISASPVRRASVVLGAAILGLVAWNAWLVYALVAHLQMGDFGIFYQSAVAAIRGQDMYEFPPVTLGDARFSVVVQPHNLNPPHAHLPLLSLALLPPKAALGVWLGASLLSLLACLRLIAREVGLRLGPRAILWLLAFVGTGTVVGSGQLALLLLFPVTLAWVEARRGRWVRSGVYLGLAMGVKLFLLIFLPWLLLRRQRRAAAAACSVTLGCFGLGLAAFGLPAYRAWVETLGTVQWPGNVMNASVLGLLSRTLGESPYYTPVALVPALIQPLWLALAALVGVVTVWVASDRTGVALDRAFALLLIAALLISPLGWVYYLWLPLGPMLALLAGWQTDPSRVSAWTRRWLLTAAPGLIWPTFATLAFQPWRWATATVGSAYFWSTAALWCALLADSHARRPMVIESADLLQRRHTEGVRTRTP